MPNFSGGSLQRQEDLMGSGGLAKGTLRRRGSVIRSFEGYLNAQGVVLDEQLNSPDTAPLETTLIGFFEAMKLNDGSLPSRSYFETFKSHTKSYILERSAGRINITCKNQMPQLDLLFRGILRNLKAEGKGEVKHYPEVDNASFKSILNLW